MAMTKEQQKAASDRIMAKFPLTPEERSWMEFRDLKPEEYVKPRGEARWCGICKAEFRDEVIDGVKVSALELFSDHVQGHYPTAEQWSEAYSRMQRAKDKAKISATE